MQLNKIQAIEIWKARWRHEPLKRLVAQYDVDPRRFYEIWSEHAHYGTRLTAFEELKLEDPQLWAQTDPAPHNPTHKRIPLDGDQLSFF